MQIDEKIILLMKELNFKHTEDDDENGDINEWYELEFYFGGGKFEIVVSEIGVEPIIFVQLGGMSCEEISSLPLTYENLIKTLEIWRLI
jgi:hypothetical protein